jgi:hypothetical protein
MGRATPNDGRAGVKPGFFPNALTLCCSDGPLLSLIRCYPQMVNKSVMHALAFAADFSSLLLSIRGKAD